MMVRDEALRPDDGSTSAAPCRADEEYATGGMSGSGQRCLWVGVCARAQLAWP
jgi:hypothetical protein